MSWKDYDGLSFDEMVSRYQETHGGRPGDDDVAAERGTLVLLAAAIAITAAITLGKLLFW